MRIRPVGIAWVRRSKGLGRGAEHFFELPAEVGFTGELQLGGGGFVGVTL